MNRRRQIDLRQKMVRDTEHFLNLSLGYGTDSKSARSHTRRLAKSIELFFEKVTRLIQLKSLRGRQPARRRGHG